MAIESRVKKSLLNARVNIVFMLISIFIAFFSRKIFIECLGVEFVGLTSTLRSLLGFLNIAELGVGTAIAVTLYKPLADGNQQEIENIVSVLAFLYSIVGTFILIAGIILSFFLPSFFKTECPTGVIYLAYYAFLLSSLITYFINYKQTLLNADQKNYVVTKYIQTANIIKLLLQMTMAKYFSNLYIWIAIEFAFGLLAALILNIRIRKTYPWLNTSIKDGYKKLNHYKKVLVMVQQLFITKISSFSQQQLSPILINSFVNISMVTYYSNYLTIVEKLSVFINALLGSTYASVGNLVAEGDKKKIMDIYKELTAIRFLVSGTYTFLIYHLIEPFITLWLGGEFILGKTTLCLILVNLFISQYRGTTDQFLSGYGLFKDVWASITEVIIFVGVAIWGGQMWGLNGILLGIVVSKSLVVVLWKPFFLFSQGFHLPVKNYWMLWGKNIFAILICWGFCSLTFQSFLTVDINNFLEWFGYASLMTIIYLVIINLCMFFMVPGYQQALSRLASLCKKK